MFRSGGILCQWVFLPYSVPVLDLLSNTLKCSIPRPKTRLLQFSPQGTYLTLWEPYAGMCPAALLCHCFTLRFGALVVWYSKSAIFRLLLCSTTITKDWFEYSLWFLHETASYLREQIHKYSAFSYL